MSEKPSMIKIMIIALMAMLAGTLGSGDVIRFSIAESLPRPPPQYLPGAGV